MMSMKSLHEIQKEVEELGKVIGATKKDLPTYGTSRDYAYPHIEVDESHYHWVVVERGVELDRKSTPNFNELLFHIFKSVTSSLAFSYELNNRVEDQDCRRIAFPKQIELMSSLSTELGHRISGEIEEILKASPYDDEPIKVVNRMKRKLTT